MTATLQKHTQPEIVHPRDYFVKFTGDFAQLKDLGYSFQKLYAANYQQWNKDDLRVWKKGQDVTHDELGDRFPAVLNLLLKMGIANLPFETCRYFSDTSWLRLYIHKDTYECTPDSTNYREGRKHFWASIDKRKEEEEKGLEPRTELPEEVWKELVFTPESVSALRELAEKGWITLEKRVASGLL